MSHSDSGTRAASVIRFGQKPIVFSLQLVFLSCLFFSAPSVALVVPGSAEASKEIPELIRTFLKAQQSFDPATLKDKTVDNYAEVSPLGELDERNAVLEFYDPAHRVDAPAISISDDKLRIFGDTGIDIVTIKYTIAQAGAPPHDFQIRATFVAMRTRGVWKMASAQYTRIQSPPTQH